MKKIVIYVLILLGVAGIGIGGYFIYNSYFVFPTPIVESKDISIDNDNNLIVKFSINQKIKKNKIYYLFSNEDVEPTIEDKNWKLTENNSCNTKMENGKIYNLFLKNENNEIFKISNTNSVGKVLDFKLNKEQIYIAEKGKYTLEATVESIGNVDETITWSIEDEKIATINQNGVVTGVKKGTTIAHAKVMDLDITANVLVTNLITVKPKTWSNKKTYLPCGKYDKEDNDLLDKILVDRMNDVGYPTRASAVEAARFLTLEFPYKVRYFSENGRGSTNGVDGEGRYYHKGLYLDKSRFEDIGKKMHGPATWGCPLYSNPSHGSRSNGLDCSGFITWVMYNGGWDVKDVGAGLASHLDMTDYGVRTKFNADVVKSGKVKVGDLLSSGGVQGGHIAMIVGQDKDNYYVAESLWTSPNVAVGIYTYSKKTVFNRYYYVMLMDSYYKEDGKLTDLWY